MTPLTPRHSCPTAPSYPIIVRADQWQNPLATTASMPWGTDRRVRMSSLTRCRVCSPMLHPLARQQRSPREVVSSACVYDEGRHGLPRRTLATSARPRPVRARLGAGLALLIPQVLGQLSGQPALQGLLEQRGQQALAARHLDLAGIKTLKQRIQRTRAAKLLHGLTPTSASRDNIIIIHHASILSNKKTDTQTIEHAPMARTQPCTRAREAERGP